MSLTLTIIKPDAVSAGHQSEILAMIFKEGFKVVRISNTFLTKEQAETFYEIHKEKPFFSDLVSFMTSGRIVAAVLSTDKPDTVEAFRKFIGDTDPKKAKEGTIRKKYGSELSRNAIHGSDSDENAKKEINFFFNQ